MVETRHPRGMAAGSRADSCDTGSIRSGTGTLRRRRPGLQPGSSLGARDGVIGWSGSMYAQGGWAEWEYARSSHPGARYVYDRRGWAEWEYARSSHPEARVRSRITHTGTASTVPSRRTPAGERSRPGRARGLSNDAVTMEHRLAWHVERLVLAIERTMTLNHDGLAPTSGVDDLGVGGKGRRASWRVLACRTPGR